MTLRDDVKQFVREQRAASASTIPPPRIGLCTQVNSDGTISVLLEGSTVNVRNPYGAVKGQDILLLPDQNGVFSVGTPTRPMPQQAEFTPAVLFTAPGGFLCFVSFVGVQDGDTRSMVGFQNAGSKKLYWLSPIDSASAYYFNFSFSADVKYVAFFGCLPPGDNQWFVYELGTSLKSLGAVPGQDEIYYLDAMLVRSGAVGDLGFANAVTLWVDTDGTLYWVKYKTEAMLWYLYKSDESGTSLVASQDFNTNPLSLDPYGILLDGPRSMFGTLWGEYVFEYKPLRVYAPGGGILFASSEPYWVPMAGEDRVTVTSKYAANTFRRCDPSGDGMGPYKIVVIQEDLSSGDLSSISRDEGSEGYFASPLLVEDADKGYTMAYDAEKGAVVHQYSVEGGIITVDPERVTGISVGFGEYSDSIRLAFYASGYPYIPPIVYVYPNWGLIGS